MGWSYQQKPPMGWPLDYDSGFVPEAGFWLMNEGGGNIVQDLSGNEYTGVINGNYDWVPGFHGSALYNNGSSDGYIDVGFPIIGSVLKGLTVECFIKLDSVVGTRMIAENGTGFNTNTFYLYRNGAKIEFSVYGANFSVRTSALSLSVNTWYHVICTWTPGVHPDVYINGILSNGATGGVAQTSLIDGNTTLQIGHRPGPSLHFIGAFSFFRAYPRTLISQEITTLFQYPFWMFKDPAEVALLGGYQAVVGNAGIMTPNTGFWGPTF